MDNCGGGAGGQLLGTHALNNVKMYFHLEKLGMNYYHSFI